jgi:hypothetical protein
VVNFSIVALTVPAIDSMLVEFFPTIRLLAHHLAALFRADLEELAPIESTSRFLVYKAQN